MAASSGEGTGTGSAEGNFRGLSLDFLNKVLIGQLNAFKTCIEIVDGKPTLRITSSDVPFDDTGLSFSADTIQEAIAALDTSIGSVTCIQDSDADTFVCIGSNDITVALGDDGSYADNPSLLYLTHSGCQFNGSDGTANGVPGTAFVLTGGDGFGTGGIGTGMGGGFNLTAGDSGDGFSDGASINITGGNNNPGGGTIAIVAGNSSDGVGGGVAGGITLNSGTSDGSPGIISLEAGSNSFIGDGAAVNITAGNSFGISGGGGSCALSAGIALGLLGDGGDVNLYSGSIGAALNPGDAGDINLTCGVNNGTGLGGNVNLYPGYGTPDGGVVIGNIVGTSTPSDLRFLEASPGANYVGFKSPVAITTNVVWELPSVDGTDLQHLTTNGTGVLRWSNNRATSSFTTAGGTNVVYAAGLVTFTHSLGEQYLSSIEVYSNTNALLTLGNIAGAYPTVMVSTSVVTVDLSALHPITGTYVIVAKV